MINLDMIGYLQPGDARDLDLISDDWSRWLAQRTQEVAALYVPGFPVRGAKLGRGNSDHASFWRYGYAAVFFHEDAPSASPFIHTMADTVGTSYNDPTLALQCTRVALALLATLATQRPETPVTLQSFEAGWTDAGVLLRWRLAASAAAALRGVRVERAARASGPFVPCGDSDLEAAGEGRWLDGTAPHDVAAWYRLAFAWAGGARTLGGPLQVTPAAALDLALSPVGVASRHAVEIRYRVGPRAQAVRLDLFDVRGRRLRTLVDGRRGAGDHLAVWDASGVPRGIYFVRLRAAALVRTRRLVLVDG
jgi:hypothetical protein